jgi:hypothetical protein
VIFSSGFVPDRTYVEAYQVSTGYELSDSYVDADGFYYLLIPLGTAVFIVVEFRVFNPTFRRVQRFVPTLTLTADKNLDIVIPLGTIVYISGYDISINYAILIQLINNYMT